MGDPSVNHVAVRTSDRDLQWRNRKCLRSRICDLAVDNQKATVRFDDHSGIGPRYFEFRQVYGQADGFEQNGCPGLGPDNRCSESRAGRKADEHGTPVEPPDGWVEWASEQGYALSSLIANVQSGRLGAYILISMLGIAAILLLTLAGSAVGVTQTLPGPR